MLDDIIITILTILIPILFFMLSLISFFRRNKKETYEQYKENLLTEINNEKLNLNEIIIFFKKRKCELNSKIIKYNELPKLISIISVYISCMSLAMNSNPYKKYEVVIDSINQLQINTVGFVNKDMAIFSLFFILFLICLIFCEIPNDSLQLEVINDLIQEYEDKLKEEKDIIKDYIQREYDFSKIKTVEIMNQLTLYDDIYFEFYNYLKTKEFSIKNKEAIKEKDIDDNKEYTAKDLCKNLKLSLVEAYVYLSYLRKKNNCEQNKN